MRAASGEFDLPLSAFVTVTSDTLNIFASSLPVPRFESTCLMVFLGGFIFRIFVASLIIKAAAKIDNFIIQSIKLLSVFAIYIYSK